MKTLILSTVTLLLMALPARTDPPIIPDVPKAVITGPAKAGPGDYVRLKFDGTIGDDPQIVVFPDFTTFDNVTFSDGSKGITFAVQKQGAYTFFLCVNRAGKTASTRHTISIEQVAPPPVPSDLELSLTAAYRQDTQSGQGGSEKKAYLVALMKQMATAKVSNSKELAALLSGTAAKTFDAAVLRATRDCIIGVLDTAFGHKNVPLDAKLQLDTFNTIADILQRVN